MTCGGSCRAVGIEEIAAAQEDDLLAVLCRLAVGGFHADTDRALAADRALRRGRPPGAGFAAIDIDIAGHEQRGARGAGGGKGGGRDFGDQTVPGVVFGGLRPLTMTCAPWAAAAMSVPRA